MAGAGSNKTDNLTKSIFSCLDYVLAPPGTHLVFECVHDETEADEGSLGKRPAASAPSCSDVLRGDSVEETLNKKIRLFADETEAEVRRLRKQRDEEKKRADEAEAYEDKAYARANEADALAAEAEAEVLRLRENSDQEKKRANEAEARAAAAGVGAHGRAPERPRALRGRLLGGRPGVGAGSIRRRREAVLGAGAAPEAVGAALGAVVPAKP